jgi:hypothetical protein
MYSNPVIPLSLIPGFNDLVFQDDDRTNILKLNKVVCKTSNNQEYKVIRYDKDFLSDDLVHSYGLARSVIVNSNSNNVIAYAPPKSISSEEFIRKYSNDDIMKDNIIAEEFVEGTMINVFKDPNIGLSGAWEIATRNTVGAECSFYKSSTKTFRTMFLEAASEINLVLENLNPNFCYSFVLQHPDNRIVVPFKKPKLYLVAIYHIDNSDKNDINVYSLDMDEAKNFNWFGADISFPERYCFRKYSDLIQKYASMNTPYSILGVVLHNKITGERAKIRNPVYEEVRGLRGNQPKLQYQYLCLRKEGKVKDFLKFYPENRKDFSNFRDQLHLFTETLYSNYVSCYIKKVKPLKEFSDQYRTHMFNIHKKFIDELRENKLFVTNGIVIKYVNELHPSLLMYCLNYNMRKRNIDFTVANNEYE